MDFLAIRVRHQTMAEVAFSALPDAIVIHVRSKKCGVGRTFGTLEEVCGGGFRSFVCTGQVPNRSRGGILGTPGRSRHTRQTPSLAPANRGKRREPNSSPSLAPANRGKRGTPGLTGPGSGSGANSLLRGPNHAFGSEAYDGCVRECQKCHPCDGLVPADTHTQPRRSAKSTTPTTLLEEFGSLRFFGCGCEVGRANLVADWFPQFSWLAGASQGE